MAVGRDRDRDARALAVGKYLADGVRYIRGVHERAEGEEPACDAGRENERLALSLSLHDHARGRKADLVVEPSPALVYLRRYFVRRPAEAVRQQRIDEMKTGGRLV